MAATWPLSGANPRVGVLIEGVTTIVWGTENMWGAYTVLRFNQRELVDNQKLPQGSGLTSTRVQIIDGVAGDITVRDDTTMTPPKVGTAFSIVDGLGLINKDKLGVYAGTVVENAFDIAAKQPGERVFSVEALTLIEGTCTHA